MNITVSRALPLVKITLLASVLAFAGCADQYGSGGGYNSGGYGSSGYNDPYYNRNDDYYARQEQERLDRERRDLDRQRDHLQDDQRRLEDERRPPPPAYRPPPAPVAERCPSGFSPSENKCSAEERRRGCKDMRMPGGLGCVHR